MFGYHLPHNFGEPARPPEPLLNAFDKTYHDVLEKILTRGIRQSDRTGTGTLELLGQIMTFDLNHQKQLPLLTTKNVPFRLILTELLWMISGRTNVTELVRQNNHIWSEWPCKHWLKSTEQPIPTSPEGWKDALKVFEVKLLSDQEFSDTWGDLGPVYGKQWRRWEGKDGREIDQLARAIDRIRTNPECRRNIVETWNVSDLEAMAVAGLPPCHKSFQFFVQEGCLSLLIYQRSCDMFLGVPFNIAFYATLTCMIAKLTKLEPGELKWIGGSCHIYMNHIKQVEEQLSRKSFGSSPKLVIDMTGVETIDDFTLKHFMLEGYNSGPPIKASVAI